MLCFAQEKVPPEDGWPGKRLANEIAAQFARIEAAFSVSYDYRYALSAYDFVFVIISI